MKNLDKLNKDSLRILEKILKINTQDTYYPQRLLSEEFFCNRDRTLCSFIVLNFPKNISIFEPGCGYGQLQLLLAYNGYTAIGSEYAKWRFTGAVQLLNELSDDYADIKNNTKFISSSYPADIYNADIFLSNNFVGTTNSKNMQQLIESLNNYKNLIIDLRLFGQYRETDDERNALASQIEFMGFKRKHIFGNMFLFEK